MQAEDRAGPDEGTGKRRFRPDGAVRSTRDLHVLRGPSVDPERHEDFRLGIDIHAARLSPEPSPAIRRAQGFAFVTTTLIASSTRSRAYLKAVGSSVSGKVCVWMSVASNRFCAISAVARCVALRPSPRMP